MAKMKAKPKASKQKATKAAPSKKRDNMLRARLLDEELDMLQALADRDGIGMSAAVRKLIRDAFRKLA